MNIIRCCFFSILILLCSIVYAQEIENNSVSSSFYQINTVDYHITGSTSPYALSQAVKIDKEKIFINKQLLTLYLTDIEKQLENQRVLESVSIEVFFQEPNKENIIYTDLIITVKDTWNLIALPYPKYDSNTGFELKLKLKNYNFFGSMKELNTDIIYKFTDSNQNIIAANINFSLPLDFSFMILTFDFSAGTDFNINKGTFEFDTTPKLTFDVPFNMGIVKSNWSTGVEFGIKYNADNNSKFQNTIKAGTGVLFSIPTPLITYNLSLTHEYTYDYRYQTTGDEHYFTEKASLTLPMPVGEIPHISTVMFTPYLNISYNWDIDGIKHSDLQGLRFTPGYSINMGRIDWFSNFREGATITFNQNFTFNLHDNSLSPNATLENTFFIASSLFSIDFGFNTRILIKPQLDSNRIYVTGVNLRGIRDFGDKTITEDMSSEEIAGIKKGRLYDSFIVVNIDLPIKLFQTNWLKWLGVNWMKYLDFEMQFSPFFDIAITQNYKNNWYAGGAEILVYPSKMRSIVARASIGIDLARFLPEKFMNKNNRIDPSYEIFVGLGLFY